MLKKTLNNFEYLNFQAVKPFYSMKGTILTQNNQKGSYI